MAKSDESKKGKEAQKTKTTNKDGHKDKNKGGGWSDLIDKGDYSNGPGDNIYVYG